MSLTYTINIEKIIPGGNGLAHMPDGLVVMVPGVLPGEKVAVKLIQKKRGYANAELVEVLEASPSRIEPPCPYYDQCGGCDLQHISYPGQLQIKQEIINEQLNRNLPGENSWQQTLVEIEAAKEPFAYRQRLRLQVDGRGRLGFYRLRSQEIVPISACLLAAPMLQKVFAQLLESKAAGQILKNSAAVELMHDQQEDKVIAVFHFSRKPRSMDSKHAKDCLAEIAGLKSLFMKTKTWGDFGPFLPDESNGIEQDQAGLLHFPLHLRDGKTANMLFEAGGFCQVNAKQNEILLQTMLDWASISSETTILDLYCGLGNFSIPAAFYGKKVIGMDLQRSAIRSAGKNAENNALENCFFAQKSAFDAAENFADSGASFDLVILDPPRQGCKEIIPFIKKIASSQVIYISCDPATLARDLALLQDSGFKIEKIQGVDMFPQTHHIETIVQLKRCKRSMTTPLHVIDPRDIQGV